MYLEVFYVINSMKGCMNFINLITGCLYHIVLLPILLITAPLQGSTCNFSSPDLMGHVSFCHHLHDLAFTISPYIFHVLIISSETICLNEPHLTGMMFVRFCTKCPCFVLIRQKTWSPSMAMDNSCF